MKLLELEGHVVLLWGVIFCRVEEEKLSFMCQIVTSCVSQCCLSSPIMETLCVSVLCIWLCVSCAFVCVSSAGCISGCEFPFPVSSPGAPPFPDDLCVVFVVELDKGPYGLGMGLIDGLVSSEHLHLVSTDGFCLIYPFNLWLVEINSNSNKVLLSF